MPIKCQRGTKDILPLESHKWHYVESVIRDVTKVFNIKEIRTPTFEATELFARGVGDTSDVVNKEMYTFLDKGEQSITLKPEGTAGVVRAFIENSLYAQAQPTKLYYMTPVFRYEKPQKGRLREHHQFGVEILGSYSAYTDAEVISIVDELFKRLKIKGIKLYINSIGCKKCRDNYNKALKEYYYSKTDHLCETCRDRLDKNPLRILDCKVDICKETNKEAPIVLDYICQECKDHMSELTSYLKSLKIDYEIDPYIVRGLDYYTKTVFEFVMENIGAKSTVCGGGRYNNLVKALDGPECPSVGFGMGIERLLLAMEASDVEIEDKYVPDLYIATLGEEAKYLAASIVLDLRRKNIIAETDHLNKSLKSQMKYADKIGARYTLVLAENEIKNGICNIKNMQDGQISEIKLDRIDKFLSKE